jgi:hypothetical protein
MLYRDFFNHWVQEKSYSLSPHTSVMYKQHGKKYVLPHLGHIKLNEITPQQRDWDTAVRNLTLDTYSHVLPGMQMEAADNFGQALLNYATKDATISKNKRATATLIHV